MDLTQLAYFRAAAQLEHFSRAADTMHVAQPALSRQIRTLETQLGVTLFDRVGRGVRLTAAGRAILPRVERALAETDAIGRDVRALLELESGLVALGFLHSIGAHLLPNILAAFRARHPAIGFTLHDGTILGSRGTRAAGGPRLGHRLALAGRRRFGLDLLAAR